MHVDLSTEPFRHVPGVRVVAMRFLLGIALMIGTLTVIGLLVTEWGPLDSTRSWDDSISTHLAEERGDRFVGWARFMTQTGDTLPVLLGLAAVTAVLALRRRWKAMLFVPLAILAEISTFLATNYLVGRERPDVERLGPLPGTYSFPSGHIAATFVIYVGIGLLFAAYGHRRVAMVVTTFGTAMALAMGWSRVYVGMHHTIDVIFGLLMGAAALTLTITVLSVEFRDGRFEGTRPIVPAAFARCHGATAMTPEVSDDALRAIAHPGRRAMLRLVWDVERPSTELADAVGMSKSATSQHLKLLRDARLVTVCVDANRRLYRADLQRVNEVASFLDEFWAAPLQRLRASAEAIAASPVKRRPKRRTAS